MPIWNHGNHNKLFIYNTNECYKTQIKNPFDPILGIGLVKDFWNWKFVSLENEIFIKDSQRIHIK